MALFEGDLEENKVRRGGILLRLDRVEDKAGSRKKFDVWKFRLKEVALDEVEGARRDSGRDKDSNFKLAMEVKFKREKVLISFSLFGPK